MIDRLLNWLFAWLYKESIQPIEPIQETPQAPVVSPIAEPEKVPIPTKTDGLYALSKSLLGSHLGKDKSIPWGVNCANALTDVLIRSGIKGLPSKGIAGTYALLRFLEKSPQFAETFTYTPGAIILNATGTGNAKIRGHVGVCGKKSVMSNNSETGLWTAHWDWSRWNNYYQKYGGIPTRLFLVKD